MILIHDPRFARSCDKINQLAEKPLPIGKLDIDTQPVDNPPGDPPALAIPLPAHARPWWRHVRLDKIGIFIASLYLFILAISLMKTGASGLTSLVQNILHVSNPINALGFGWLFAYVMMSGSPVAAAALAFFNAGVIDQLSAFAMITGSRLGASFIVLFIGFVYTLRGRDRATSLSMGLLSLSVTASTYLPALLLGTVILKTGVLDQVQLHSGALLSSFMDLIIDPVVNLVILWVPSWMIFLVGLGIILVSFNLFDKCLPQMSIKESRVGWMSRLVYRPAVMFGLGALITLVSMSVSVSLSILVPLSSRGFVRRENVIPYIMGANITTFIDTLLAAVLLNNPPAFTVVLVEMLSVTIMSILILSLIYPAYLRQMLKFVTQITSTNRNLAVFMILLLLIPLALLLF
jgi:solute carrier family 34 (sodium-dependent phosphate cotransporter)